MLRGLSTVNYPVADIMAARAWYVELLGIEPYFERPDAANPAYVEFRIGDYQDELALIDSRYAPRSAPDPGGTVAYWHVDDAAAALERLQAMGATVQDQLTVREAGFVTASVIDPFGNILGLMYSPHYLEVLASTGRA